MSELPDGPFFDLIREWNAGVAELRAKAGYIPPGHMYAPAATIAGMKFIVDPTVPADELLFRNAEGKCIGKIVGLSAKD